VTAPGVDGAACSVFCFLYGVSTSIVSSAFRLVPFSSTTGESSLEDDPDDEDPDEDDPDDDEDFLVAFAAFAGTAVTVTFAVTFAGAEEESLDDPELELELELDFLAFETAFFLLAELLEESLPEDDPELEESDTRFFFARSASNCAAVALA